VSEFLTDVDDALIRKYEGEFKIDFFHWGTMAAAARFADTKEKKFLDFIRAQTETFLDRKKERVDNDNTCASIEGVADAMGALLGAGEGDSELVARARSWVATEIQKVKQLQIQPGKKELVFSNARIVAPRMQEFAGSFRSGIYAANTQVDLTAHCVSAMVKLERYNEPSLGN
jgi:hypothetical protein